jgi:hypothetical protein
MWLLKDILAAVFLLWGVGFYSQGRSGAFRLPTQIMLDAVAVTLCVAAFNLQAA